MSGRQTSATRLVTWYTCECDWISKYCDDHHTARAHVPTHVLDAYRLELRRPRGIGR